VIHMRDKLLEYGSMKNKVQEMIPAGSELLVHNIVVQALMTVPKCYVEERNFKSSRLDVTNIICGEMGGVLGIFHVLSIYDFLLREEVIFMILELESSQFLFLHGSVT
jgi:hypothetical protein